MAKSKSGFFGERSLTPWHWACFFVLVLSAAVYGVSLGGTPIWEDHRLIDGEAETLVQCFTKPFLGLYFRPLVTLSFFVDHQLGGHVPFVYHQTNILIHVLTTLVLLGAFRLAFGSRRVALMGAFLFAVQPAQVSAVAWIGGRTDSLCVLWVSVFAWALLWAARSAHRARGLWLGASALAFGLALLTKEQAVALLPLVPLGLSVFALPGHRPDRRALVGGTLPFVGVVAGFVLLWKVIGPGFLHTVDHGIAYRLVLAGQTLLYYALLLVAPTPKTMHLLTTTSLRDISVLGTSALGFVLLALCGVAWRRWRRTDPASSWWLAWAVLAILPVANWLPDGPLIIVPARAALAGVGAAALLGRALSWLWDRGFGGRALAAAYAIATLALTGWGVTRWQDSPTLYATLGRHDPGSLFVREGQIGALMNDHREPEAQQAAEAYLTWVFGGATWRSPEAALAAFRGDPSIVARIRDSKSDRRSSAKALADLLTLLGYARMNGASLPDAGVALETADALDPANPSVALAQGQWNMARREYSLAIGCFDRSIAKNPRVPTTFILRGTSQEKLGLWAAAAESYSAAIALQPWAGHPYLSLAFAREKLGDEKGARKALEEGRERAQTDREEILARLERSYPPAKS